MRRGRLREVIANIAAVEESEIASGTSATAPDPASQAARRREVEALHQEKRALTAEILQELGLRAHAAWPPDATAATSELPEGSAQRRQRPISGGGGRGRSMLSDVGAERVFPRPDRAGALDHHSIRRPPFEGASAALPRLLASTAGDEVRSRHSPSPLQPPPPLSHPNHRPPWQSMDLAYQARVAARGGGSGGDVDRPPSERPPLSLPSSVSSPALAVGSRYEDAIGGARGRTHDLRDHRRVSRSSGSSQSQWSSYPGAGPPLSGHEPWIEGSRSRDRGFSLSGAGGGPEGSGSAVEHPFHQYHEGQRDRDRHHYHPPSAAGAAAAAAAAAESTSRPKRMRDPLGGSVDDRAPGLAGLGRGYHQGASSPWSASPPLPSVSASQQGDYGRSGSSPQHPAESVGGGAVGIVGASSSPPPLLRGRDPQWPPPPPQAPSSSSAAEAAIAMTRLSPPPPWDLKPSVGDARLRQHQQDYRESTHAAGLGLPRERPWPGSGTSYPDQLRGLYPDDPHLRGSPAPEFHHEPPQQHQDRLARLRSFLPPVPEAPLGRASPLRMDREEGEAAGLYGTGARPPLVSAGMSDAERLPYAPLPRLVESVGGPGAPLGDGRFAFGESTAAAAVGAGAYRDQGQQQQRRRLGDPTRSSVPAGSTTGSGRGCKEDGCDRRPIYAYKGSKKAAYCARHRLVGMIDTRHPLCKNEHCTRQPSFGMEGDRRASYCAEHKLPEMINVSSRRCQHTGCLRHPNFGFPGDRRASYCSGHRETGMVDIVSRRCREPSCGRRPLYNMDGLRPVCCSQHKSPGMIDVVSTRCQEPGCFCHPSFGYASDKKARRCARHRLENMEGVKGHRQKRRREVTAAAAAAAAAAASAASATATSALSPAPSSSTSASNPTTPPGSAGGGVGGTTRPSARAAGATSRASPPSSSFSAAGKGAHGDSPTPAPIASGAGGGRGEAGMSALRTSTERGRASPMITSSPHGSGGSRSRESSSPD